MTSVQYPQGSVLPRIMKRPMPLISHGEGIYLYDQQGKRYIDGSSGAFVTGIGHGNAEVADAIAAQLKQVGYVNGTHFANEPAERLAQTLNDLSTSAEWRATFLNSGSEAVEAAIKFARQVHYDRGNPSRSRFIARNPSYHGNTLMGLSLSWRPHYNAPYGPLLSEVVRVSAPMPSRSPVEDYEADGADFYAKELEETLLREGPETFAALIVEPVIGSSAGASTPPPGYFEKIREVCDRHGVLIIADEIFCGCGRVGSFYASEAFGLDPDFIVMGKGLGGGYGAVSAVLAKQEHCDTIKAGTGKLMHAQTYMLAPMMCAVGNAVLDYMSTHNVVENAQKTGGYFQAQLRKKLMGLPTVYAVNGVGFMAGVDFADPQTGEPFERGRAYIEGLQAALFDAGVVTWTNVGHVDGVRGDILMIGPPLITSAAQVDELTDILRATVLSYGEGR